MNRLLATTATLLVIVAACETDRAPEPDDGLRVGVDTMATAPVDAVGDSIATILAVFPPGDLPGMHELADCSSVGSSEYYYGLDRPVDYEKARCAAFREFADRVDGPFSGASVLMMLYANGYGVEQNLDLAIRLAMSEDLTVFAEPGAYESSLRSMKAGSGAGEFDVCDFVSGGVLFGMCMSMWRSPAQSEWRLRMEPLIDEDEPLRRLMDEFTASRIRNEIELSGTAGRYVKPDLEESFLNAFHATSLELFEAGRFPMYTEAHFREADRDLNRIYSELRSRESWPFGNDPEELQFESVRETQRLWLRYRDAWVEFGQRRYPHVSSWSWLGWLTTWRNRQLDAIGGTPGYEPFLEGVEDSEVRRRVEESLVPGGP